LLHKFSKKLHDSHILTCREWKEMNTYQNTNQNVLIEYIS